MHKFHSNVHDESPSIIGSGTIEIALPLAKYGTVVTII